MGSTEVVVVSFDIAQSLGWAAVSTGKRWLLGCGQLHLPETHSERLQLFDKMMEGWSSGDPKRLRLATEDVQFARFVRSHASHWKIRTMIELAAEARGLELELVNVKALKEWATGSGSADKTQMIAAAHRLFPHANLEPTGKPGTKAYEKRKGDICDAVLVAGWAAGCARPLPAGGSVS